MIKSYTSRLLVVIFTIFFILILVEPGFGQREFGIQYTPGDNVDHFEADLDEFRQTGINNLMVQEILNRRQMEIIQSLGFNVYVSVPIKFPTIWTLLQNRDGLIVQWGRYIDFYRQYSNVRGISLFSFGQMHRESFRDFFAQLTREIDRVTDIPLTYISSDAGDYDSENLFDHRIYQVSDTSDVNKPTSFDHIGGIVYSPATEEFNVRRFQSMLSSTASFKELPIFLEWDWYKHNMDSGDLMETVVHAYASDPNALFANPREQPDVTSPNWLILILLAIWGSFVVHYSLMPTYRKSLFRFFDTHKFFMSDVMERHIRVGKSSTFILFQLGLVGGLYLLALTKNTLSPLGFEALIYHLPIVQSYTPGYMMIFLAGFLFFFLLNLICIGWLFLMNSGIHHLSQAAIFQLWGQHLNLFIVTLLITLILSGRNIITINIVAILFLVIFFGSFVYAVIDAGKFTYTRYYYFPLTIITYLILLGGFGFWLIFYTGFNEIWDLATSLN
ncbi:MAG: hypothetical protein WD267_03390 [Balneolales bacterium]